MIFVNIAFDKFLKDNIMVRRNIINKDEMEAVIKKCEVCYVGMCDLNNNPYVVPFNFAFHEGFIYLHSAMEGKKVDILKLNNKVSISFSTDYQVSWQTEEVACSWGMKYRSVMVFGKVEFIEEYDSKIEVLNLVMKKYAGKEFSYNAPAVNNVRIYKIDASQMTGRVYGHTI